MAALVTITSCYVGLWGKAARNFLMGWAEASAVLRVIVALLLGNSSLPFTLFFCFVKDVALFRTLTHFEDFTERFRAGCGFD